MSPAERLAWARYLAAAETRGETFEAAAAGVEAKIGRAAIARILDLAAALAAEEERAALESLDADIAAVGRAYDAEHSGEKAHL